MMKKAFVLFLAMCLWLCACTPLGQGRQNRYTATYLDVFDTVTTVVGYAQDQADFDAQAQSIYQQLQYYHALFDIYHEYEGVSNLKTVNDCAGVEPVKVDAAIIALLKDCKAYYDLTGGKVNVAMGSVLQLWHEERNKGIDDPHSAALPEMTALQLAAEHTDIGSVVIDEAASTVYITDPLTRLDVGAIAKGWTAQKVAESAPEGMLISVGGNVCVTGAKPPSAEPWVIGIQNPFQPDANLHTVSVIAGTVVTSGDYQRTYTVNGIEYHHIIDPQTLMPAENWCSVTVFCEDSAIADALSTALFLMPLEEGKALAGHCNAEALWVDPSGQEYMTSGVERMITP